MYKTARIVANKPSVLFCIACLSTDRRLYSLDEYLDIFINICGKSIATIEKVKLCWECLAVIRRVKTFKGKVEEAQRTLNNYYLSEQNPWPKCLSTLKISARDNNTINIQASQNKNHTSEGKENQLKIDFDVKHENDDYSDCLEIDITDDLAEPEIRIEEKTSKEIVIQPLITTALEKEAGNSECTKTKRKFNFKYRILFDAKSGLEKNKLRKKLKIEREELDKWLEKEGDSPLFKDAQYKCLDCISGWKTEEELKHHNAKYHFKSQGEYSCSICKKRFSSERELSSHTSRHYYVHHCLVCGYRCYKKRSMDLHMSQHDKPVQCKKCAGCFSTRRVFFEHYNALHTAFLCDACGKRCLSRRVLIKHMSGHAPRCGPCGRALPSARALRRHARRHHARAAYCVSCDKRFVSRDDYVRHVRASAAHRHERQEHSSVKPQIPCPDCGKLYTRRTYMNNHYKHVHLNSSRFYCQDCDKNFLNSTRYKDHRKYKHEGAMKPKDKLCNICGRGFNTNRVLVHHMRTHSGERPHECQYCAAKFTQKHAMLSHVKYIHLKSKRRAVQLE